MLKRGNSPGLPSDPQPARSSVRGVDAWQNDGMKRATAGPQAVQDTGRAAHSRVGVTSAGRSAAVLAGCIMLALSLAACNGGSSDGTGTAAATPSESAGTGFAPPGTTLPSSNASGAAGPVAAEPAEDAATALMKQKVSDALSRLAAGTPKPATAQVTDALTGAGVAPAALEVSASRTPTGLAADAIEAGVLQGTDCVIGQVRDGSVTVTVLPVLASGKCFVGAGA